MLEESDSIERGTTICVGGEWYGEGPFMRQMDGGTHVKTIDCVFRGSTESARSSCFPFPFFSEIVRHSERSQEVAPDRSYSRCLKTFHQLDEALHFRPVVP